MGPKTYRAAGWENILKQLLERVRVLIKQIFSRDTAHKAERAARGAGRVASKAVRTVIPQKNDVPEQCILNYSH